MVAPHVEVRQELEKQTDAAERASYKARALLGLYSDPAGVRMIQRQTQALKEQASFAADAARLRRRVEIGGFAEGMENAQKQLGKVQAALEGIARQAGVAFAVMSAGIGAAVRSASPAHWDTLRGSVQLLGGAIGQAFLPAAREMAGVIQKAAAWVRGLDEGVKGTAARMILWTAGLAGAAALLFKVGEMVVALGGKLSALGAWVSLNPWVLALAGVAAAVWDVVKAYRELKDLMEGGANVGEAAATWLGNRIKNELPDLAAAGMNPFVYLARKMLGGGGGQSGGGAIGGALGGRGEQDQLLLSMGGMMPRPGFHTGAGYGEALQLASLQGEAEGDLAAERHREQLEMLEKLLGEDGLLKKIADNTGDIKGMVPPWR